MRPPKSNRFWCLLDDRRGKDRRIVDNFYYRMLDIGLTTVADIESGNLAAPNIDNRTSDGMFG